MKGKLKQMESTNGACNKMLQCGLFKFPARRPIFHDTPLPPSNSQSTFCAHWAFSVFSGLFGETCPFCTSAKFRVTPGLPQACWSLLLKCMDMLSAWICSLLVYIRLYIYSVFYSEWSSQSSSSSKGDREVIIPIEFHKISPLSLGSVRSYSLSRCPHEAMHHSPTD